MEFDNEKIIPTYIFKYGIPGSSYGIEIAQRMGINKKIIEAASTNLDRKSFEMENLIREINTKQKMLEAKLIEVDLLRKNLNQKQKNHQMVEKRN